MVDGPGFRDAGEDLRDGDCRLPINPNVAILLSGLTILVTWASRSQTRSCGVATLVLASLVPFLIPIGVYLVLGEKSKRLLHDTMQWMVAQDRAMTIGTLVLFGMMFTWRGTAGLL